MQPIRLFVGDDIRMPGLDGLQLLDRLQKLYPEMKVVMLSGVDDPELATEALRRGAKAFLGKGIDPAEVAPVFASGLRWRARDRVVRRLRSRQAFRRRVRPTGREREILKQVAAGHSNKQIAADFWLSEQTIKYHLTYVYRKVEVGSRTEAARFAYEHGLAGNALPSAARKQNRNG